MITQYLCGIVTCISAICVGYEIYNDLPQTMYPLDWAMYAFIVGGLFFCGAAMIYLKFKGA